MHIERINDLRRLQSLTTSWDCLAHGSPFRSWGWIEAWWRHFGDRRELHCLAVFDAGNTLVGMLPLFRERDPAQGMMLRCLGTVAEVAGCPALLTTCEHAQVVTQCLTEYLCQASHGGDGRWDQWHIEGENANDRWLARLIAGLVEEGHGVSRHNSGGVWQIPLTQRGEEFSAKLSTNHRQQLRKSKRRLLARGELKVRRSETREQLREQFRQLISLYTLRQTQRQGINRLQSSACVQFLREATETLWHSGQATIFTMETAGRVIAADLVFFGGNTAYAYLAGWHPGWARYSPGNVLQWEILQQLLAENYETYDLLASPANYARHWRALLRPTAEIRLQAKPKIGTPGISICGEAMRAWLKSSITLNGMR